MQTNVRLFESDDHKNEKSWNCHICTFVNGWKSTRCKMCFTNQKDEYTKGLESQIQKLKLENNGLKFEIDKSKEELLQLDKLKEDLKIKDEENIALKFEIEKLKEELLEMDNVKEQLYELECKLKQQQQHINKQNIINNHNHNHIEQKQNYNISQSKKEHKKNEIKVKKQDKISVIYQGHMLMKHKLNSNYEKLWFLFYSNNTLAYYSNLNNGITELPIGQINLYLVTNIKEQVNNNTFHIITHKRTFSLRVINLNEYNEWINIIKLSVSPRIIFKEWLYKKKSENKLSNLGNKSWNLRYFILCHNYATKCHEMRYYEDEKCNKYKGYINCNDITIKDITFLPNATKLQQYGKDLLLELTTQQRIYIFAAKDINSKRLWYESLSKISDMPRISHSRNASNSMTIPSIPPTPKTHIVKLDYSKVNKNIQNVRRISNSINNNMLYAQNQLQLLTPISESGHNNDNNDNNDNVIMLQSDINDNIQCDEWGDVNCELSSKNQITSPSPGPVSPSDDGIGMYEDSYMNNRSPRNEMSYMSQNTVMLMDINKEVRPKLNMFEFNNSINSSNMDIMESPTSITLEEQSHYAESVAQNDADLVIHAPFNINALSAVI